MISRSKLSATVAWSAFFGWACLIFYLSSLTSRDLEELPSELLASDKLVHAIAYAVGGFFLSAALRRSSQWRGLRLFCATIIGIGLFGASDEFHQLFTPGRSGADLYDWIADMVGGSLAAFVYSRLYGQARPRSDAAGSPGADSTTP